jgi:hypothetical protein
MMSEDRHDEEIEETGEGRTDRREFLKKTGLAAGALAAMAGLGSIAEAQNIRLQPRPNIGRIGDLRGLQVLQVPSTQQFVQAFDALKQSGQVGPRAMPSWNDPLARLNPAGRLAGVIILEMSQRQQALPDAGKNLAVLFTLLARGMANAGNAGDLRAAGNGCGNQCGYGCAAPVATGFICGNNCIVGPPMRERMAAQVADGFICGNNCSGAGLQDLTIDANGDVLGDVSFKSLNMTQVAGAMRNAAQAYAKTWPQW